EVVCLFPQARISQTLGPASGAVGVLARWSGAPVVPVAITGTEDVHAHWPFARPTLRVRFGTPMRFEHHGLRSLDVADQILQSVASLLADPPGTGLDYDANEVRGCPAPSRRSTVRLQMLAPRAPSDRPTSDAGARWE